MADRTGQQLGNYHLTRLLGQGGFAEVYLSEHIHLGTPAAIKLLHTHLAGEDIDLFRREARIIARLVHPHIVRVFDFGIEGETPFLVMDYAPNGTLRKKHPKGVALLLPTVQSYVKQIADALQYAHDEEFIHRDIKPENLLVGRRQELLLSDFGIALIAQTSRSQSMQDVAGTASYMAPEQFQGKPRPASDQYALAVMVYEWLTGTCPFHGSFTEIASQHLFESPPPLHGRTPDVLPAVEQVVMTALAKDPHRRFGSVRAFATAFEQASQIEPALVQPTSQSSRPAEIVSQQAQTPAESAMPSGESFIATEPILVPAESVTPPGQMSSPSTEIVSPPPGGRAKMTPQSSAASSFPRLLRLSGGFWVVGGVLIIAQAFLNTFLDFLVADFNDPLWRLDGLLVETVIVLFLLGLPGLYVKQPDRARVIGLVSIVILFAGNIGLAAYYILLFSPATNPTIGQYYGFFNVSILLAVIGGILLSIAIVRASLFPRWAGIALMLSTITHVLFLTPLSGTSVSTFGIIVVVVCNTLLGVGLVGCGQALLSRRKALAV